MDLDGFAGHGGGKGKRPESRDTFDSDSDD